MHRSILLMIPITVLLPLFSMNVFASPEADAGMKIVGNQHPEYSINNPYTLVFQNPLTSDTDVQVALLDDSGKTMITLTPIHAQKFSKSTIFTLFFTPGVGIESGNTYYIVAINGEMHATYEIIPVSSDQELEKIAQPILKLHSITESLIPTKWNVSLLFCAGDSAMDSTWVKISSDMGKQTDHVTLGLGPHSCSIKDYVVDAKIPVSITPSFDNPDAQIPQWIKNDAKWWSKGEIQDSDFVEAMQYLIGQKIIVVPPTKPGPDSSQSIPKWIKANAGMWADGWITDDEFLQGIQYLISNGILKVY